MSNLQTPTKGTEVASGAVAITVEKHKIDFKSQYGEFSDKPSENITRWLEKGTSYQKAHMIPSLEMASIIIHCIKGEPKIKIQRMLDVPGEDYKHADHFDEQPEQKAVPYSPFKPRREKKDAVTDANGAVTEPAIEPRDAEPAIMPVRFQPKVEPEKCLKAYLLKLYSKRVNLTEADKFLATFKTQKPRQTCSNYLDEFAINYENYAHLKWTPDELKGYTKPDGTVVASNIKTRQDDMLRLVAEGLCSEFKTHCDNTDFILLDKTYIQIEEQVMHWQRSTTTGKKFTASCIPAKQIANATVSTLEFDTYLDRKEEEDNQDDSFTCSTQLSQQSPGNRGGARGRGSQRGTRGRGGRGRGANVGANQRPIISRDVEDGNHPNYKQTPDGQLQKSIHGYPLCNYCGGPSHKRQNCPVKLQDRANGNKRIFHPDRDKGTSIQDKMKKQEQQKTSATMGAHYQPIWQHNSWPHNVNYQVPPPQDSHQLAQQSQATIVPGAQDLQHTTAATSRIINQQPRPTPCPYPTCQAILSDFNQTQAHMNQYHTFPILARGPGTEP